MYDSILLAIDSIATKTAIFSSTIFEINGNISLASAFLGAGFTMLGALAVGLSQGMVVSKACEAIGRNPEAQPKIMTTMIVGLAITESSAIYCLIVAILLLFVAPTLIK